MMKFVILVVALVLSGCALPDNGWPPYASAPTTDAALSAERPQIQAAIEIWNQTFRCKHELGPEVADGADIAFDAELADGAARYDYDGAQLFIGPEALAHGSVTNAVLHELGHAHHAWKHVEDDGSLFSAWVDPHNVTIDQAMIDRVCRADAACCD